MAPARSSTRRALGHPSTTPLPSSSQNDDPNVNKELFLDPMLGTPLAIYVDKDVDDKELISQLIVKHGGTVSQGYSGVPYILVDPHKSSGQNLYRQYVGKKGKIVLSARWVHECVKEDELQTFHNGWAGCKVTGSESLYPRPPDDASTSANRPMQQPMHPHSMQPIMQSVEQLHAYPFHAYAPPISAHQQPSRTNMPSAPPGGTWQVIAPSQTHLHPPPAAPPTAHHLIQRPQPPPPPPQAQPPTQPYRDETWDGYNTPEELAAQPAAYEYPRFREDQNGWVGSGPYYEPSYEQGYHQPYMEEHPEQSSGSNSVSGQPPMPTNAVPSSSAAPGNVEPEKTRGRKRARTQGTPAAPATSLVVNRNPPARSPTPPTRVVKSTYGGNLFTADDVLYLKKYIDYCQDQSLVLSLREICERIAVRAPHHTFYSWRRYCNKHQIRLGGYTMNHERSESPDGGDDDMNMEIEESTTVPSSSRAEPSPSTTTVRLDIPAATAAAASAQHRNRSPTPPRALYRSTTGKGVAFTQQDVTFLVKFMAYRKSQGTLDMVAFWKDVAVKAPHHSRASWMKFWRRHKHELDPSDGDEPLPAPPDKKMRYSKEDDILLAKYFHNRPDGTSDKIFQAFGRLHPHHPWKGWQEHHRIHKNKIENLMERLGRGESLDDDMDER